VDLKNTSCLTQMSFALAVARCNNLDELQFSLHGPAAESAWGGNREMPASCTLDEKTLQILRSGPPIRSLEFGNWSDGRHILFQLLDVWPSVKALTISGAPPFIPPKHPLSPPPGLEQLRMNFQYPPTMDFMTWLLSNSVDTLRILEFEREPSSPMLDALIGVHGGTLQSISMPVCASYDHVQAVLRCRNLKELKVESPWAASMLYKSLPDTMQHIALGIGRDTVLNSVLETVRTQKAINTITAHIWDGGEFHPQLAALKIACACQGVELRLTRDIRHFRAIFRGNRILPTTFPRASGLDHVRPWRCGV